MSESSNGSGHGHWSEYVEVKLDNVEIDSRQRPDKNESAQHFFKKVLLAHKLHELGHPKIELEFKSSASGLRYDVYAPDCGSDYPKPTAVEVGHLNTPSRKVIERFRATYKDADAIIWWPKEEDSRYLRVLGTILDNSSCEICADGGQHPLAHSVTRFTGWQPREGPPILLFFLEHLFDPGLFHSEFEQIREELADGSEPGGVRE